MSGNGTVGAVAEAVNVLMSVLNVLIRHPNEHVYGHDELTADLKLTRERPTPFEQEYGFTSEHFISDLLQPGQSDS
jgi:hypothetical protein